MKLRSVGDSSQRRSDGAMDESLSVSCILNSVLYWTQDSARLWSLWAKAVAVGNAQRCPRQGWRCAAGASSTNPQPGLGLAAAARRPLGTKAFVDPATQLGAQLPISLIGSPNGCLGAGEFAPVQLACLTRMGV